MDAERYAEITAGRKLGDAQVQPKNGPSLDRMTMEERAYAIGLSHACPVVGSVIAEFGALWTVRRYTECNHILSHDVYPAAQALNPQLYTLLISPVPRGPGEKPGPKINRTLVPANHDEVMSPLSTPEQYGLPRAIRAATLNKEGKGDPEKVAEFRGILKDVVPQAKDPIGLTLRIEEKLIDVSPEKAEEMVGHLLDTNKLGEEGCKTRFKEIISRMVVEAPYLFGIYERMAVREASNPQRELVLPEDLE